MKHLPHGEAALPLLALALFVLLFVAWPLVDVGLLVRPLPGLVFLIVTLSGLYAFGAQGRVLALVLTLGGIVFVLQTLTMVWPLASATITAEVAAELFVLVLCGVLLSAVLRPGNGCSIRTRAPIWETPSHSDSARHPGCSTSMTTCCSDARDVARTR